MMNEFVWAMAPQFDRDLAGCHPVPNTGLSAK
jgi:hypothetical protein